MRTNRRSELLSRKFLLFSPLGVILAVLILYFSYQKFLTDSLAGCCLPSSDATGEYEESEKQAVFENRPIGYKWAKLEPSTEALKLQEPLVLGEAAGGERWIEIDLSDQKLYAHEGDRVAYEFLVSSGKPWTPTPRGEYRIWVKLRYTKMSGGVRGTRSYYYLPNVPYTQYFYKGYGLHGTYWHNNFGHTMSHGCVNLATPDAEKLFYWTLPPIERENIARPTPDNPGTRVVIHE